MKTTKTHPIAADTTDLVFKAFMQHLEENFSVVFKNSPLRYEFTFDVGSKYIRVWHQRFDSESALAGDSKSSYCFIERATGDVLKCASWKKPAPIARGNIFDGFNDSAKYGVGMYGAELLARTLNGIAEDLL